MIWIVLGLILWVVPHMFKRLAPQTRAKLGDRFKAVVAIVSVIGIVLMVIGYRGAAFVPVYAPLPGMGHLNNLLMLVSIYCFGIAGAKTVLADKFRHPMLTGVVIWATAHLLVNGDLASIVLFGGLGIWAVAAMLLINVREPVWARPAPGSWKGDARNAVATLVIYGLIAAVHIWLGHNPFLGTYG